MGLDMYLNKKVYLGFNYEHNREGKNIPDLSHLGIDVTKVTYVIEEAGYWRKANAIHAWFVNNVQDGNDDCSKQSDVSREAFELLLEAVNKELEIKNGNCELGNPGDYLPCQQGFFFGAYNYGEWYYKDLEYTKELIEGILNSWDLKDCEYYYQSSW